MTISNIERFDEIAAQTLAQLYENFPVPSCLMVESYGVSLDPNNADDAMEEARFVAASFRWLNDAGYIRYSDDRLPVGVMDAVLTVHGLQVLKAMPPSLGGQTSIGERLIDGLKAGGKEAAKEAIREALAYGSKILLGG